MRKRFILYCIYFICLITILSGCKIEKDINMGESALNELTSREYEGRLLGTEGNEKAQIFLEEKLDELNISHYRDGFSYEVANINSCEFRLGKYLAKYEKDYVIAELREDIGSKKIQRVTFVESYKEIPQDTEKQEDIVYVVKSEELKPFSGTKKYIKDKNILNVTSDFFEKYKNSKEVYFLIDFKIVKKSDNNIVGFIGNDKVKDNKNKEAIVLSAHFDHIGKIGDAFYQGALDNASGVATVLLAANQISNNLNSEKQNKDLYIVFFNGEEQGLLGSATFAERIQEQYGRVLNINVDCAGKMNKQSVEFCSKDNSSEGVKRLAEALKERISIEVNQNNMLSDHKSFPEGMTIYNSTEGIHTLKDVREEIDINLICELGSAIGEAVLEDIYLENKVDGIKESYRQKEMKFMEYYYRKGNNEVRLEQNNSVVLFLGSKPQNKAEEKVFGLIPKDIKEIADREKGIVLVTVDSDISAFDESMELGAIYQSKQENFSINNILLSKMFQNKEQYTDLSVIRWSKDNKPVMNYIKEKKLQAQSDIWKDNTYYISSENNQNEVFWFSEEKDNIYGIKVCIRNIDGESANLNDIMEFINKYDVFKILEQMLLVVHK